MNRAALAVTLCMLAGISAGQVVKPRLVSPNEPVPQPTTQPVEKAPNSPLTQSVSRENAMAAESLRRAAVGVMQLSAAPGRGGRAMALALASERLDPTNREIHRMLADFMEITGHRGEAARQAMLCLRTDPNDYGAGLRWLNRSLVLLQGAQARTGFLADVARRENLPKPLRAEAAARKGMLQARQGLQRAAVESLQYALQLDPLNPAALTRLSHIRGESEPVKLVPLNVKLLKGNPMSTQAAWTLGTTLGIEGVYKQSLTFFDYAWLISQRKTGGGDIPNEYVANYVGAILDANAPNKAIRTFADRLKDYEPTFMVKNIHEPWDLRVQMIQAYRLADKKEQASELAKTVTTDYASLEKKAETSTQMARQIALFHAITMDDWKQATPFIKIIERIDTTTADTQALVGAMKIREGQPEVGEAILQKNAGNSVWACALLADHLYRQAKAIEARKIVQQAARISRRGWAFRHLRGIVQRYNDSIPDNPYAGELRSAVKQLTETYIPAWTNPEKLLSVTVKPVSKAVYPGESIDVEVTLRNTGTLEIPLGNWGLLSPAVAIRVTLDGTDGKPRTFDRLPMIALRAPRYLAPGASVTQRGPLRVGPLRKELASRPMENIVLKINTVVDPVVVERDKQTEMYTPLPSVPVETVTVTRRSLQALYPKAKRDDAQTSFRFLVAYLVRDMRKGKLPQRLRTARLAGSLLGYAQRIEAGDANAPQGVPRRWISGYAKSMLRELLDPKKQPSFAVRAEALGSLRFVGLDKSTKSLLADAFDDPSEYVRLRVVELVGSDDQISFRRRLGRFSDDPSLLVKSMVSAYGEPVSE